MLRSQIAVLALLVSFLFTACDRSSSKQKRPTQAETNAFVGLTEKELIKRLGQPISVETSNSPDGPFKMLQWDRTKGRETFFTIFADDGLAEAGYYRGVPTTAK